MALGKDVGERESVVWKATRTLTPRCPAFRCYPVDARMVHRAMSQQLFANARQVSSVEIAIIDAFHALALERRYGTIRVLDIIDRAGVGKSTFYEHFRSKNDVLLAAMHPVLLALATAASGRAARSYVRSMVAHLWERRSVARPVVDSTAGVILQRCLADTIARHGGRPEGENTPLFAVGIAAAQLAMLRHWLAGHATATVDTMTDQIIACAQLQDEHRHSYGDSALQPLDCLGFPLGVRSLSHRVASRCLWADDMPLPRAWPQCIVYSFFTKHLP